MTAVSDVYVATRTRDHPKAMAEAYLAAPTEPTWQQRR
jgi:hypothetical protein